MKRFAALLVLLLPLAVFGQETPKGPKVVIPNPGLEKQGEGWWFEPGHGRHNRVEWITEDSGEGQTCAKLIYYEFYDYPHERGRFQLVRHTDKHRTLGLVAYAQAIRYLTGASYEPQRCEVWRGETDEDNLPCRVFGRGGETIVCLWSNYPTPAQIEIRTKDSFASAQVSTFSPEGQFLSEQALLATGQLSDGPARIVSERHLVVHINALQFMILSLR